MIVHEEQPFNAERGLAASAETLTATNAFYVRGHGDVPDIDPDCMAHEGAWRGRA
jgi:sulfite oxidase